MAKGVIPVEFHKGRVLSHLSRNYKDVPAVILEMVQNFLDARAEWGIVTLNMNSGSLSATDNGVGTTLAELGKGLQQVGLTTKDEEDLGEFAIGKFAPLAIATGFSLTSHQGREPFFRVTITRKDLEGSEVNFPYETLGKDFKFMKRGTRTMVNVKGIKRAALKGVERMKEPAKEIADLIADRFGARITQVGTRIDVVIKWKRGKEESARVKPSEFPGSRDVVEIDTKLGSVKFELYKTIKPVEKPKVFVQVGGFRVSVANLSIYNTVNDVFGSGYIQGVIHCRFVKVAPERDDLEFDEGFEYLWDALKEFCNEYGRPFIEDVRERKRIDRYAAIASRIINTVERVIRDSAPDIFEHLKALVSKGHIGTKTKKEGDTAVISAPLGKRKKKAEVPPSFMRRPRPKERKKKTHGGTVHPRGRKTIVMKGQKGITVRFEDPSLDTGFMWRVRMDKGVVVINCGHKEFEAAERRGDSAQDTYIRLLVLEILSTLMLTSKDKDIFQEAFESAFLPLAEALEPAIPKRG